MKRKINPAPSCEVSSLSGSLNNFIYPRRKSMRCSRRCWIKTKFTVAILISSFFYFNLNSALALDLLKAQLIPNDPDIAEQYYLEQVRALEAWDKVTEASEVVVAVIDTGVDIYHPDLSSNIWINSDEIKGDQIDNDNNGYVDDYQGWDFILGSSNPRPKFGGETSSLGINHGTIVSGIIGARGNNNLGIAGVAWKIKIMALRALNNQGYGEVPAVVEAINYAIDNGADIINLSLVGNFLDQNLEEAIKRAYQNGLMIMAAAGNESSPNEVSDLTYFPRYPICYDGDNNYVFGVGAVGFDDVISSFSNYGSCVDIMAPGEAFFSTRVYEPVFPDYQVLTGGYWSGTSVATPLVSAAAAIVKSLKPGLANFEIYELIKDNADSIDLENPDFIGLMGAGRLNVNKVVEVLDGYIASGTNLIITPASDHSPLVKIVDISGSTKFEFMAYNENFTGGVNLATADINNNGIKEIITAAGAGGGPHVRVFTQQGEVLNQFFAYDINFSGGVNIVATDIDNDGEIEIITAPKSNFKPQIKIFSLTGELKSEFLAYQVADSNGLNLALSDINGDGQKEIVVSHNGDSIIKVFDMFGNKFLEFESFYVDPDEIKISGSNIYLDDRTEFLVTNGAGAKVKIFSSTGNLMNQFTAFPESVDNNLNLMAGNIDSDQVVEIIVSNKNQVKIFGHMGDFHNEFNVYETGFLGGVNLSY